MRAIYSALSMRLAARWAWLASASEEDALRLLPGLAVLSLTFTACGERLQHGPRYPGVAAAAPRLVGKVEVPPPPFSDGVFPCTACHDPEIEPNTERRTLELAHAEILLRHDEEHRWCHDCHSAKDFDKLHLANGELIDFTESYRLCGQCHGDKYRDWRAGAHGRRSGSWDEHKTYLLCVHCHSSHDPKFKKIAPLPVPIRPGALRHGVER